MAACLPALPDESSGKSTSSSSTIHISHRRWGRATNRLLNFELFRVVLLLGISITLPTLLPPPVPQIPHETLTQSSTIQWMEFLCEKLINKFKGHLLSESQPHNPTLCSEDICWPLGIQIEMLLTFFFFCSVYDSTSLFYYKQQYTLSRDIIRVNCPAPSHLSCAVWYLPNPTKEVLSLSICKL